MDTITVKVPATSANCGPGFDSLGLALELYNTFTFTPDKTASANTYTFSGFDADTLAKEDQTYNLVGQAMQAVFQQASSEPIYGNVHSETVIPPSRGLGSSSTAIVAGLLLANRLLAKPLTTHELLVLPTTSKDIRIMWRLLYWVILCVPSMIRKNFYIQPWPYRKSYFSP